MTDEDETETYIKLDWPLLAVLAVVLSVVVIRRRRRADAQ